MPVVRYHLLDRVYNSLVRSIPPALLRSSPREVVLYDSGLKLIVSSEPKVISATTVDEVGLVDLYNEELQQSQVECADDLMQITDAEEDGQFKTFA